MQYGMVSSKKGRSGHSTGYLLTLLVVTNSTCFYWLTLIKLQAFGPAALLKRDSSTGVFMWNFSNFQ